MGRGEIKRPLRRVKGGGSFDGGVADLARQGGERMRRGVGGDRPLRRVRGGLLF